jgi:hypothetical protein
MPGFQGCSSREAIERGAVKEGREPMPNENVYQCGVCERWSCRGNHLQSGNLNPRTGETPCDNFICARCQETDRSRLPFKRVSEGKRQRKGASAARSRAPCEKGSPAGGRRAGVAPGAGEPETVEPPEIDATLKTASSALFEGNSRPSRLRVQGAVLRALAACCV